MVEKVTKRKAKRGRPAKLSRELILQCALRLLVDGPAKVSISSVARALNSAPMSLYTHVKNRDDLLLGVSDLVLGQVHISVDEQQPWQLSVREWVDQVHDQLLRYPQVVALISETGALPPHWLRVHSMLVRYLHGAGFRGQTLSHAARWLAQLVVSDVLFTWANPHVERESILAAMEQLDDEYKADIELLIPHTDNRPGLFEFMVDQAIGRLEFLLAQE